MEEFILEFDPMQSQRVQEAFQHIHTQKNAKSRSTPHAAVKQWERKECRTWRQNKPSDKEQSHISNVHHLQQKNDCMDIDNVIVCSIDVTDANPMAGAPVDDSTPY